MVHGLILVKSIGISGEVYKEIYWFLGEKESYIPCNGGICPTVIDKS